MLPPMNHRLVSWVRVRPICASQASQKLALALVLFLAAANGTGTAHAQTDVAQKQGLTPIREYIASGWDSLTRSLADCKTIVDPKLAAASVLYIPADFEVPAAVQQLRKQCNVQTQHLPMVIHNLGEVDPGKIDPAGLLYLPSKYVVPGGRFNEMYGWDSYFIIRGLVRDKRLDLAQGMVENFFFEIEHYGAVLNANRTYYLTRSQPPFLTSMILAVYEAQKAAGHEDRAWLEKAYGYAARDYGLWTREPHLAGSTGLSRYYDFGNGPAPESLKDETGHLTQVAAYFLGHPGGGRGYLVPAKSGDASEEPTRTAVRVASLRHDHVHGAFRLCFGRKRRADLGLLQGRPRHARIGLRHFVPLRTVRRGHPPLRSCLSQQLAIQNRGRPRSDERPTWPQERSR